MSSRRLPCVASITLCLLLGCTPTLYAIDDAQTTPESSMLSDADDVYAEQAQCSMLQIDLAAVRPASANHVDNAAPEGLFVTIVVCATMALALLVLLPRVHSFQAHNGSDARSRDASFDHAKWMLSATVVFRHLVLRTGDDFAYFTLEQAAVEAQSKSQVLLYYFFGLFNMPTFAFLSGFFSRNHVKHQMSPSSALMVSVRGNKQWSATFMLLLAGLNSVLLQALAEVLIQDWDRPVHIVTGVVKIFDLALFPWYLMALFLWRTALPVWSLLRYPITCAFFVAALSMLQLPYSLEKSFFLFPFFVVGYCCSPETLEWLCRQGRLRLAGGAVLVMLMVLLRYSRTSTALVSIISHIEFWPGAPKMVWTFLPFHLLSFTAVGSFLCAVQPLITADWGPWMDAMSQRSLYSYIFHEACISYINLTSLAKEQTLLSAWKQSLLTLSLTVAICIVTTSFPIHWLLSPFLEPRLAWLFQTGEASKTVVQGSPPMISAGLRGA